MNKEYKAIDFHYISKELNNMGCPKSVKQCRDRWLNHLDPTLIKDKWNKN